MKVGVLGSGDVAKVLAAGFLTHGHDVMIGTRTPAKLADLGEGPFEEPNWNFRRRSKIRSAGRAGG